MKVLSYKLNAPDHEYGEMIDIENSLDVLQKYVDGWIDVLNLSNGCVVVLNENGLERGLEANATITSERGIALVHGDFFICGKDGLDFKSIDTEKIEEVKKLVKRV